MQPEQYKRRKQAAEYLKAKYGHGSPKTLAKLACIGGGPEMVYAGSIPLYWAEGSTPGRRRSSARPFARPRKSAARHT